MCGGLVVSVQDQLLLTSRSRFNQRAQSPVDKLYLMNCTVYEIIKTNILYLIITYLTLLAFDPDDNQDMCYKKSLQRKVCRPLQ